MAANDISEQLQSRIFRAVESATRLCIIGGNSKTFYGREPTGEILDVSAHQGIVNYDPTELVISARAGTRLQEIEQVLAQQQQMLAFEPPAFGDKATLGGTIACNLSGPRRSYVGAARDFVLGTKILNGKGELLKFGGEVMKNVAGYDVSRLMAGAMGTLGVMLEVSLKVLPRPELEQTLALSMGAQEALEEMQAWALRPLPITATCFHQDTLYVRISGTARTVQAAAKTLGGDSVTGSETFWLQLKEHQHPFFHNEQPLWRLSLAADAPVPALAGDWLYEWGGALRWLITDLPSAAVQATAAEYGGHATLFRNHGNRDQVFQPLPAALLALHRQVKAALDPHGIFNVGRLYAEF